MSEDKTKKFCPKCGAELNGDAEFCTKCGASLNRDASSQSVTPDNQGNTNKSGKKEKKKGSKKTGIIIAVIAVVLILVVAMSGGDGDSDDSSIDANALIEEVQNGYLGNYDAVAVKDVFEYEYGIDGDWTGGTPEDDDSDWYFLVQYEVEDEITIQFQIYEEDDTEFHVTYLAIGDPEYVYETAYDIKGFLDMCYGDYVSAYPDCGVVIDESTDNNTVVGHFASAKTASENSENTETDEATNETETTEEASEPETGIASEAVEGVYMYNDGSSIMTADITVADDGAVYVSIEEYTSGGRYGAYYYERMDARLDDGSYYSTEADELSSASVTFYEGGMKFQFSGSSDEYLVMDGDYQLLDSLNLYGTYVYDDGEDNVMTADVYMESDTGNTVIYLVAISYDRYTAEFTGTLWRLYGNVYYAEDEDFGCCLTIEFETDGMTVTVDEAEYVDFEVLGGEYNKTADLDMDQVG